MRFLDGLRSILTRERCERSIKYDGRKVEMGAKAEVPGVSFSIDEFKTEVKKIREASQYAELLDNYDYRMCKICNSLRDDKREWKKWTKIRMATLQLLTTLQSTLISLESDPEKEITRLKNIVDDLQKYATFVTGQVAQDIERMELGDEEYKSEGGMSENAVSKALDLASIPAEEGNNFVEGITSTV